MKVCEGASPLGWSRERLEEALCFAGFLVFAAPLKRDARRVVENLELGGVHAVVLTGDHPLAACRVARDAGVLRPPRDGDTEGAAAALRVLVLKKKNCKASGGEEDPSDFVWREASKGGEEELSFEAGLALQPRHACLCVEGGVSLDGLLLGSVDASAEEKATWPLLDFLVRRVRVFARLSPEQKRRVVLAFQRQGLSTLMCGDGVNDVAALKAAAVGVSVKSKCENQDGLSAKRKAPPFSAHALVRQKSLRPMLPAQAVSGKEGMPAEGAEDWLDAIISPEEALLRQTPVSASIASNFASGGGSLQCCIQIVAAGRGALASTLLLLRLAALNSVATAFCLSVLAVDGVKFGDSQAVLESVLTSALTLAVNSGSDLGDAAEEAAVAACVRDDGSEAFEKKGQGAALAGLGSGPPVSSVFHAPVFFSTVAQALVHVLCVSSAWRSAAFFWRTQTTSALGLEEPLQAEASLQFEEKRDGAAAAFASGEGMAAAEEVFQPNACSSCVFLLLLSMHVSAFLANYEGAPYALPLRRNRSLCNLLLLGVALICVLLFDLCSPLTRLLQLEPLPDGLRLHCLALIAADILLPWALNKLAREVSRRIRKPPPPLHGGDACEEFSSHTTRHARTQPHGAARQTL